jgi:hypothetical protein
MSEKLTIVKYEKQLDNIKKYLSKNGLTVDEVIRWQGGFTHQGTDYGLTKIATVIINGEEKTICVPKFALNDVEIPPYLEIK